MFLVRLKAFLQLVQIDLNEGGSSGSYDLHMIYRVIVVCSN